MAFLILLSRNEQRERHQDELNQFFPLIYIRHLIINLEFLYPSQIRHSYLGLAISYLFTSCTGLSMMRDHHSSTEENYKHGSWGKVDTKSKLLVVIVLSLFITIIVTFEQLFILLCMIIFLGHVYRVRWRRLAGKSAATLPIILSLAVLTVVTYPEGTKLILGETSIHFSQIETVLFFLLKSVVLVISALLPVESEESFFRIVYALDDLKMPSALVAVLFFMYRTSIDLRQEVHRMMDARYVRSHGLSLKSSIRSYMLLGYMIGGLLSRTLIRNEQKRQMLYIRGYEGHIHHDHIQFSSFGLTVLWLSILIGIGTLFAVRLRIFSFGEVI